MWSTYNREPVITTELEKIIYDFIIKKSKILYCYIHDIGGIEDHVHISITIPPNQAVSKTIGVIKGSCSHYLNKELKITNNFAWQDGFGVLSFHEKMLPVISKYIKNQKKHHKNNSTNKNLETTETDLPEIVE
jgi:putative transposase